jgi:succinate dehydrogenase hydrophobic anchor subunit
MSRKKSHKFEGAQTSSPPDPVPVLHLNPFSFILIDNNKTQKECSHMILSTVCLVLAALSLAALGVCAWMGMKASKSPDATVEEITPWLKRCLVFFLCLVVFGCLYFILSRLGGGI